MTACDLSLATIDLFGIAATGWPAIILASALGYCLIRSGEKAIKKILERAPLSHRLMARPPTAGAREV